MQEEHAKDLLKPTGPFGEVERKTVDLWGVCALAGLHGNHQWGMCAQHAPCTCSSVEGAHLRVHPQCQQLDASKERSHCWPSTMQPIQPGDLTLTETDGKFSAAPTIAWFYGLPSYLALPDVDVMLHVRNSTHNSSASYILHRTSYLSHK